MNTVELNLLSSGALVVAFNANLDRPQHQTNGTTRSEQPFVNCTSLRSINSRSDHSSMNRWLRTRPYSAIRPSLARTEISSNTPHTRTRTILPMLMKEHLVWLRNARGTLPTLSPHTSLRSHHHIERTSNPQKLESCSQRRTSPICCQLDERVLHNPFTGKSELRLHNRGPSSETQHHPQPPHAQIVTARRLAVYNVLVAMVISPR